MTKKNIPVYNATVLTDTLRNKTEKSFVASPQDYINVTDLLADCSYGYSAPTVLAVSHKNTIGPKTKMSEKKGINAAQSAQPLSTTQAGAHKQTGASKSKLSQKSKIMNAKKSGKTAMVVNHNMKYRASYELGDVFSIIDKSILDIKQKLMSETDTNKSLDLMRQLSDKLKDKQVIEQNLDVASKIFLVFKNYINNICSNKR